MVLELLPPVILYIPNTVNQKHITQTDCLKQFCVKSVNYYSR